jgi:hypothetical protein
MWEEAIATYFKVLQCDNNLYTIIQTARDYKKHFAMFESTAKTLSWNFTLHPEVAVRNKRNSETQNGAAAAESYVCLLLLGSQIRD